MLNNILLLIIVIQFNSITSVPHNILTCYYIFNSPPVDQIDAHLCTHVLLIGSTTLQPNGVIQLPPIDQIDQLHRLQKINSNLKLLITLCPRNPIISRLVEDTNETTTFVNSVTKYLVDNRLDGFDIDWEFPVWSDDAAITDRDGLTRLLMLLRKSFDASSRHLLLTLAVSAPWTITKKGYDINAINKYADYVNVMNYDFHWFSHLTPFTGHNAPLGRKRDEPWPISTLNSAYSIDYWIVNGLNSSKILFGIPTYGRGFTLLTKYLHYVYAPAVGISIYGEDVDYPTVCKLLQHSGYKYVYDRSANVPYTYGGRQWISFEDERSIAAKVDFIKNRKLGGAMMFSLTTDDVIGVCGNGTFPLVNAIKRGLSQT